jgi:hypothetical protein
MLGFFGFLLWLGFCGAVATAADTRGRNSGGWFLLAFFVTPLLAVCFLLALPKVDREQERQKREQEYLKRIAAAAVLWEEQARRRERRREWRAANLWPLLRKLWAVTPREVYAVGLLILWGGAFWSMSLAIRHTTPMGVTYFDYPGVFFTVMDKLSFFIVVACLAFLLISGVIRVAQLLLRQTRGTA